MRMMKKTAWIFMISVFCLFTLALTTYAGTVSSVSAEVSGGKITVSGKTGSDVLAVAIMVYDSSDNLIDFETGSVINDAFKFTLSNTFSDGTYTIKAADYDGGNAATTTITVGGSAEANASSTGRVKDSVPKTGEEPKSPIWRLAGVTLLISGGILIKIMKKKEM